MVAALVSITLLVYPRFRFVRLASRATSCTSAMMELMPYATHSRLMVWLRCRFIQAVTALSLIPSSVALLLMLIVGFRCVFCLKPYQYQSVTHPYNIYKCITFEYKERKIRQVFFLFSVDISFIEVLYCNKTGTFFDFPWTKPLFQALFLKIEKTFRRKFRFRCENVPLLLQPKIATKLELCPVNIKFSNYCSVFRLFPWPDFDSRQLHCTSEHTGKCPGHYIRPDEELR